METLRIEPGEDCGGAGRSRGLARGLLVRLGDLDLAGEGVGIGGVALRDRSGTCFSRSWTDRADDGFERTFLLDTRMAWSVRGRPSPLLARGIESGVGAYMRLPALQPLRPAPGLRRALQIESRFETAPPAGRVTVTCAVTGGRIDVRAEIRPPVRPKSTVCLLNELSGEWFTAAVRSGEVGPPPPGWEAIDPADPPALFDPVHGLRFAFGGMSVAPSVPARLFWGRERAGELCWAGFCLELGPLVDPREPVVARYGIELSRGGGA